MAKTESSCGWASSCCILSWAEGFHRAEGGVHFWDTQQMRRMAGRIDARGLGRTSPPLLWPRVSVVSPSCATRKWFMPNPAMPIDNFSIPDPPTEGQAWWTCSWQLVLKRFGTDGNHHWESVWLLNLCPWRMTRMGRQLHSQGWCTGGIAKLTLTFAGYVTQSELWTFLILVHKGK